MKKILPFLLLITGICHGQIVNVPDPGFKYNLIMEGVDTNNDGNIQVSEALATTSLTLHHLENDYIEDITGLEAFINLTYLEMNGWPSLGGTLDVTMMPNLTYLDCSVDQFTSIDVTGLSHLETLICEFNAIPSLDLTGCTALKALDCSSNPLTTLDLSQAPNLESFKGNHTDLTNVNFNGAPALKSIYCEWASLTTVNVSALTQLELLELSHNEITAINLGTINNLKTLTCWENQLTNLDVAAQTGLITLTCANNQLTQLNVSSLVNLKNLACDSNPIMTLDVTSLAQLTSLSCSDNQLTALNLNGLDQLKHLYISDNSITGIDLTHVPLLNYLVCSNNPIASLDLTANPLLMTLHCENTAIGALDVSMLPELEMLRCGGPTFSSLVPASGINDLFIADSPLLAALDLTTATALAWLHLYANSITTLDLSNCPNLMNVGIIEAPNLTYINAKNGFPNIDIIVGNAPNLAYICADEQNIAYVQSSVPGVMVNSYCSFVPGGMYNTISGMVRFDGNGNGCDANDSIAPMARVALNDGVNQGVTLLNNQSGYQFFTGAGTFNLSVVVEEPSYFNVSVVPSVNFASANQSTATRNICLSANGIQPDAEVLIMQNRNARPGFDAEYKVIYRNKGNQTVSGSVTVDFDDSRLDFVSSEPSVTSQASGILTWDYVNLAPFETRLIDLTVNVNSPMETPAVNDGDFLDYTATLAYSIPDVPVSPMTTSATLHQTVVNSLDPNDKTCLEGNTISPDMIGNYVHYNINFENIGSAPAQNIVVRDAIDTTKFDINTLQVIYASHPVVTRINGNVVEFIFENIELAGTSGENKGNVVFKLKTLPTLVLGNTISNKAAIFFDYNFPIETNEATSTFAVLKNREFVADATIGVFPNPTQNKVNVKASSAIRSLQLFDVQGRLLQSTVANANETSIDISAHQNGIYFLAIQTEKGSKVEKLVKE